MSGENEMEKGMSLKYKLLLYMMASVIFFGVVLFIGNTFFVEKYYMYQKKKSILKSRDEIAAIIDECAVDGDGKLQFTQEQTKELFRIENAQGQSIMIRVGESQLLSPSISLQIPEGTALEGMRQRNAVAAFPQTELQAVEAPETIRWFRTDSNGERLMEGVSLAENSTTAPALPEENLLYQMRNDWDFESATPAQALGEVSIAVTGIAATTMLPIPVGENELFLFDNQGLGIHTVQYQTQLADDVYLYISMPMSAISEGANISNRFLTMIGLVTALVTIVWAFYISHRFTRPIADISQITTKMQSLDFSEKISYIGNDELGVLSRNVNNLSETLSQTIGELNEKNKALAADIDREREIDQMRRGFISSVSHELKTPIFLIQGYADGLKSGVVGDAEKREFYCDVITEEAEKMGLLVQDLLTIARLESGAGGLDVKTDNIAAFVAGITEKYELAAGEKGIRLEKEIESPLYAAYDAMKLEQVVTNFINNAIEHVGYPVGDPAGDRVDEPAGECRVKVSVVREGQTARVAVYNSGAAIDSAHQENLWDSFYKADEARTRELGGAGLGLSIARAALEAHGCAYGVENVSDGVVFWFQIGIAEKPDDAEEA